MNASVRRLAFAIFVLVTLVCAGSSGFWFLGHGRWEFAECVYMTVITLSTVGFGELSQMHQVPGARLLTMVLIVSGVGALAYVQGNLTALLVEGVIGQAWRRNRMRKAIAQLERHVVVAGAGSTGRHVIEELVATGTPFIVIDRDLAHLERLSADLVDGKMLYVNGDATDDQMLLDAGVERARGVVAALTHDKDNLFVTLTARSLNGNARIISKIVEDHAGKKMLKAGASAVVNPAMIGGRRMASELVRPEVNEFLDQMLRDKTKNLRIEEASIPDGSSFVGQSLKDCPIRRETKLLVIAVRDEERQFVYNPDPDYVLASGTTLIVMGDTDSVNKLRKIMDESVTSGGASPPGSPATSSPDRPSERRRT
ncbi:MAG: potassium channel protein [Deltaproteobacteria bacterium]|nr:potassium channel protein [Deltaproteobacteria bacterium]